MKFMWLNPGREARRMLPNNFLQRSAVFRAQELDRLEEENLRVLLELAGYRRSQGEQKAGAVEESSAQRFRALRNCLMAYCLRNRCVSLGITSYGSGSETSGLLPPMKGAGVKRNMINGSRRGPNEIHVEERVIPRRKRKEGPHLRLLSTQRPSSQ